MTETVVTSVIDGRADPVAYAWITGLASAMRCSREIRAGTIWINTPMMRERRAPFGGCKQSGIGRHDGTER